LNTSEREREIRQERAALWARIHAANTDLIERAEREGVTVALESDDTLRITIGQMPGLFYTQRVGDVAIHMASGSDEIVGFVIVRATEYAEARDRQPAAFADLLPALRRRGVLQMPPRTEAAASMGRDLRGLVPA
jgi:hypothetical protein